MLAYEDALRRLLEAVPAPRVARLELDDALGLALARPVAARLDLPRFDNSAVDGYAVRPRRGAAPDLRFRVIGTAAAGCPFPGAVGEGEAVRIFTGAPLPRGAEAVLMQEQVRRQAGRIAIASSPAPGQHIRRRGEDLRRGDQVLAAGTVLRSQEIGTLAALGARAVAVAARPTVAVLTTGDELQRPGAPLKPGQIYESNGALVRALVRQAGATPRWLGVAPDGLPSLTRAIRRGLQSDVLVITGGVSVGDKDFVRAAARRCGVRQLCWQVSIKPGMPFFAGRRGRTLVFGLPGNPVSVFVTFEELVKPALARLMGRAWADGYTTSAALATDVRVSASRRTHFMRVQCVPRDGRLLAQPLNGQGSHHLRTLVEADGWIRLTADEGPWPAGAPVLVKQERDTRQVICDMSHITGREKRHT